MGRGVQPGTCSCISQASGRAHGTQPCLRGVRATSWPASQQRKWARSRVTPLQAWLHPARLLASGSRGSALGAQEAAPGSRLGRTCRGLTGLPPCRGAEGLEGSRVSRQPLVQLRTSVFHETFREMGTRTALARCGHKGRGCRWVGQEGGHQSHSRRVPAASLSPVPHPLSNSLCEAGQGSDRPIKPQDRASPLLQPEPVATAAADGKLSTCRSRGHDCHLCHLLSDNYCDIVIVSPFGEKILRDGESGAPLTANRAGGHCGLVPTLPWGLLAGWPVGLTARRCSQPGLHSSASPSRKLAGESIGLTGTSKGAPLPLLGTKALGQTGVEGVEAAGTVLGHEGGRSETMPPGASAASDPSSLAVRMSIRCFRMLAMVSKACSRARLYRKCRGPGVPRRSASLGSR